MATTVAVLEALLKVNSAGAVTELRKFDSAITQASRATDHYVDAQGRLRNAQGRYVSGQFRSTSAQTKGTKATSALGQATSRAGSQLRTAAGYAASAAAAYLSISQAKAAITTTQDLAKTTAGLNRNLGLSVKRASEWGAVAKSRDIDSKALTLSFTTLSRRLVDTADALKEGGDAAKSAMAPFDRLGISQREVMQGSKDLGGFLPQLADSFGDAAGGAERQASAQELLGRGYSTILPLFSQGAKGLQEQQEWADKYGATLSGKTLDAQMALVSAQRESKVAILGMQVSFAQLLTPALDRANDAFQRMAAIAANDKLTSDEKWQKLSQQIGKWAERASDAFLDVFPEIVSKAGENAPKIAAALVKGFLNADIWGKLAIGVWLVRAMGGWRMIDTASKALGTRVGKGMGRGVAIGVILGLALLIPDLYNWARDNRYEIRQIGVDVGNWLVNSLIDTINAGINQIGSTDGPIGGALKQAFGAVGVSIPDLSDLIPEIPEFKWDPSWAHAPEEIRQTVRGLKGLSDGLGDVGKANDEAGAAARKYLRGYGKVLGWADDDTTTHQKVVDRALAAIGITLERGQGDVADYVGGLSRGLGRGNDQTRNFRETSGGNFLALSNVAGGAFVAIIQNLNNSLGKLGAGAKKINYTAIAADPNGKSLGRQHGGLVPGFRTGSLVPGSGSGDKVPLHLGGQLAAMVEPGELVSVANRNATAALMAHNAAVPRFASGGVIQQALGPYDMPPIAYDPSHAGGNSHLHLDFYTVGQALAYGHKMQQMGWSIDEYTPKGGNPWGFGGISASHQSPGHYDGTAFDANTAADETRSEVEAVVRMLGGKAIAGGLAVTLKKVLVDGPDGPMKDLAQAGVDKAWKAASAYLSKHSPAESGVGFGSYGGSADVKSLPASLQRWNHTFPGAVLQNDPGAWMNLATMPFNVAAAIAEWAGMPGVTMAQVSKGEGGLRPGSMGDDNGDGSPDGYGWLAITRPYGDSYGVDRFGGYQGMLNPVANAIVAKGMYDAQGLGAWYGQRYVTDTNAHYSGPLLRRQGGLVAKLAKGSDGKWTHEVSDPGFSHGLSLSNLVRLKARLAELTGESGSIARIDERIDLASRLAALDSSPAGSELSAGERSAAISLNSVLLGRLVKERDLSNEGLALVSSAMKYASPADRKRLKGFASIFNSNLIDVQGLTGKGGRIADVLLTLAELGSSSSVTTDPDVSDIADLGQIIDAARYGTFDYRSDPSYAGTFGRGGRLRAGQWGVAGETGKAEVIAGPARVFNPAQSAAMAGGVPASNVNVENNVYLDGLELVIDTKINGKLAKHERKAWLAEKAGR